MHEHRDCRVTRLTAASMIRRAGRTAGIVSLAWAMADVAAAQPPGDWQSTEAIVDAAEQYVYMSSSDTSGKLVATAGFLDPRLQLPRCTENLDPFLIPGTRLAGRIVVGVRCGGENEWKIYLPVHVGVMEEVVVTVRPVPRGHVIGPDDVGTMRRDVSALVGGYITKVDSAVGRSSTRAVARGIVLQPSLLHDPTLIEKGQTVTLKVNTDAITIQMTGIAESDGTANELIQVRNTGSGKIVEGRVRSEDVVEILLE